MADGARMGVRGAGLPGSGGGVGHLVIAPVACVQAPPTFALPPGDKKASSLGGPCAVLLVCATFGGVTIVPVVWSCHCHAPPGLGVGCTLAIGHVVASGPTGGAGSRSARLRHITGWEAV